MQLLAPEEVKKGATKSEDESRARVRDLSDEETRLVSSVNLLREDEKAEKERIESDVAEFRAMSAKKVLALDAEIGSKKAEVESLESRRAEAMRPIEEIRQAAESRMADAVEREQGVAQGEKALMEKEEGLIERLELADDRKQELDEREQELDSREGKVAASEEATKMSSSNLEGRWVEYHSAVTTKNAEVSAREEACRVAEEANATRAEENTKEAARLFQERRAIQDGYVALEQAKTHLGIK